MTERSKAPDDVDLGSFPRTGIAVIAGASGGIGGEMARQISGSGFFADTLALSRRSAPPLDLTDEESIAAAARACAEKGELRLFVDATGFLHNETFGPEKSWRYLDADHLAHAFAVNATGPALLLKHFLPLMPREGKSAFVSLSARVGSIGDNRAGGWYAYRASKAALNQLIHTASIELARKRPEAICAVLHPGTVDTALSEPFSKTGLDVQEPAEAAARLLEVIDGLTAQETGGFFDHRGDPIPW